MAENRCAELNVEALKERFLECDICSELFDEEDRHPRLLPCLHTLCKICIVRLIKNEVIECPKCRKTHRIPNDSIRFFPKDNTRRDLMDFINVKNEPSKISCEFCDKNLFAKYRCRDCSEFLCTSCYDFHRHSHHFKSHKVFPTEGIELDHESIKDFKHESFCNVQNHEDRKLSLFCDKESCRTPICELCALANHISSDGHKICNIKDVYDDEKSQMEEKQQNLEAKREQVVSSIESVEQEEACLDEKGIATKVKINAQFGICEKILQRRRDELLKKVDQGMDQKSKILQEQKEDLSSLNDTMIDAVGFLKQSLLYKNYPAFLGIAQTIANRFDDLTNHKFDLVPHENACFEFVPTDTESLEFQKYMNNAGSVQQTSAYPPATIIEIKDSAFQNEDIPVKVILRNYSHDPVTSEDCTPMIVAEPLSENLAPLPFPCNYVSDGQYHAVLRLREPGRYSVQILMMGKKFSTEHKEIEINKEKVGELEADIEVKHSAEDGNTKGMDFKLDASSLHKDRYISDDGLTLSNTETDTTHPVKCGETNFAKYLGVKATSPICRPENCIIEAKIQFDVKQKLTDASLVFEIAFAKKEKSDVYHHCRSGGWCIFAANCDTRSKICMSYQSENEGETHIYPISKNARQTSSDFMLVFLVNTTQNQIQVIDQNRGLIHTFTDVDCDEELWPLFAVYNPHLIDAQITLRNVVKGNSLKLPSF